MEQKQENPIKLLLSWSGKSKRYLFASVACAFASGLFVIGPYIGQFYKPFMECDFIRKYNTTVIW